jgi:hypothetical protein
MSSFYEKLTNKKEFSVYKFCQEKPQNFETNKVQEIFPRFISQNFPELFQKNILPPIIELSAKKTNENHSVHDDK